MDKRQAVVRANPDPLSIFNGNSQTGEKPGIQNPKFAFDRPWETALVIMDVWNHHPYIDSQNRVGELAPMIDLFATRLRKEGVLIIHSCSSPDNSQVSGYYRDILKNDPNSAVGVARRRGKASVSISVEK
jgi:hypothetical protein